jgi:DNA-binding XRE family transcriptional regulator
MASVQNIHYIENDELERNVKICFLSCKYIELNM